MFEPLPHDRFARFHEEFQGDTWDLCTRCGGKCEINKIGSLMPGEAEFIAKSLGVPVDAFRQQYLDGIRTPFGVIDVLKMKPGCPFLDACFHCTIKNVKVVLCEVYPVVFEYVDGRIEFSLDAWCPIVRHAPALKRIFKVKAIPAIERLGCQVDWYRGVALYDLLSVDYHKLFAHRAHNLGYVTLDIEDLKGCLDDDAPPPELGPPQPPRPQKGRIYVASRVSEVRVQGFGRWEPPAS